MGRRNENLETLLRELRAAGVTDIREDSGKRHIKVRWQVTPTSPSRLYVIAKSGSDCGARYVIQSQVRKYLRMDGVAI